MHCIVMALTIVEADIINEHKCYKVDDILNETIFLSSWSSVLANTVTFIL